MTQATAQEALVLKDTAGNYYLITQEMIQAGRVPADRAAELEQALTSQDVSGFYSWGFDKINVANITQSNKQVGANIIAGAFVLGGPQTLAQLAGNTADVKQA